MVKYSDIFVPGGFPRHTYNPRVDLQLEQRLNLCKLVTVARGIKRVYVATLDPDPRNSGAGIQILKAGGVEVSVGTLEEQALKDLGPYLAKITNTSFLGTYARSRADW